MKTPINFTASELYILNYILHEVYSKMEWDEQLQTNTDCGDIVLSLNKVELTVLRSIITKI